MHQSWDWTLCKPDLDHECLELQPCKVTAQHTQYALSHEVRTCCHSCSRAKANLEEIT